LFDRNTPKDEGIHGSKPKLKTIRFGKTLELFTPSTEDDTSHVKIPRINIAILATPFPVIPI